MWSELDAGHAAGGAVEMKRLATVIRGRLEEPGERGGHGIAIGGQVGGRGHSAGNREELEEGVALGGANGAVVGEAIEQGVVHSLVAKEGLRMGGQMGGGKAGDRGCCAGGGFGQAEEHRRGGEPFLEGLVERPTGWGASCVEVGGASAGKPNLAAVEMVVFEAVGQVLREGHGREGLHVAGEGEELALEAFGIGIGRSRVEFRWRPAVDFRGGEFVQEEQQSEQGERGALEGGGVAGKGTPGAFEDA